jgi:hypothetical protein
MPNSKAVWSIWGRIDNREPTSRDAIVQLRLVNPKDKDIEALWLKAWCSNPVTVLCARRGIKSAQELLEHLDVYEFITDPFEEENISINLRVLIELEVNFRHLRESARTKLVPATAVPRVSTDIIERRILRFSRSIVQYAQRLHGIELRLSA